MIFLDIDGVICDWNSGFCELAKIDYPETDYIEWDWAKSQVAPRKIWSYRMDSFYWSELPLFPYSRDLVKAVEKINPKFRFLTSSPSSSTDHAAFVHGRSRWVYRNFGQRYLEKLIITCGDKSFCAQEGDWLIDDKAKNILDFRREGGNAFLWKEIHRERGDLALEQFEELNKLL